MEFSWEALFALLGTLVAGFGGYKRRVDLAGYGAAIIGLALFFTIAVAG